MQIMLDNESRSFLLNCLHMNRVDASRLSKEMAGKANQSEKDVGRVGGDIFGTAPSLITAGIVIHGYKKGYDKRIKRIQPRVSFDSRRGMSRKHHQHKPKK